MHCQFHQLGLTNQATVKKVQSSLNKEVISIATNAPCCFYCSGLSQSLPVFLGHHIPCLPDQGQSDIVTCGHCCWDGCHSDSEDNSCCWDACVTKLLESSEHLLPGNSRSNEHLLLENSRSQTSPMAGGFIKATKTKMGPWPWQPLMGSSNESQIYSQERFAPRVNTASNIPDL